MAVRDAVERLFFHFGEDVADDFGGVVGGFLGAGYLGSGLGRELQGCVVGLGREIGRDRMTLEGEIGRDRVALERERLGLRWWESG